MKEWKKFLYILAAFLACFYLPVESMRFNNAIFEALALVKWYAREHVLLCLVPAFFIAGAISVFISQASVMKYFGAKANKFLSYSVASISGTILAVCSCTVLPLFSGIYNRGAGLGPAVAFLYSGPAINVLAIILTARILGWQLGLARALGAILFSVVIGLLMHLIFLKEERARHANGDFNVDEIKETRSLGKTVLYFASMIAFFVFANWGKPLEGDHGIWSIIYQYKWWIAGFSLISLVVMLFKWFKKDELKEWTGATWVLPYRFFRFFWVGYLYQDFC